MILKNLFRRDPPPDKPLYLVTKRSWWGKPLEGRRISYEEAGELARQAYARGERVDITAWRGRMTEVD